jgi:hypothetical protein
LEAQIIPIIGALTHILDAWLSSTTAVELLLLILGCDLLNLSCWLRGTEEATEFGHKVVPDRHNSRVFRVLCLYPVLEEIMLGFIMRQVLILVVFEPLLALFS